ncbi:MAG: sensor histidine kinase [Thermodesulfobacteriota bacterium]
MDAFINSGTIMVVDDKPSNLKLLGTMLKEKGHRVRIFPRGELAVTSAINDPPDLILLDINMPGIDGYEVCRRLKENEATRDLPVVFISALTDTGDKIKAFQLGGVDFITKPFQVEEVHARVDIHLTLKRVKAALEEKNRALERAFDDLKNAQQKLVLSEKMAAVGVLVAGIAHEINNPVNFIKTSTIGLEQDIADLKKLLQVYEQCGEACPIPDIRDQLHRVKAEIDYGLLLQELSELTRNILEGVRRTEEIVDSLRIYSRMDRIHTEKTDLHGLIDASLVILKNRYKNQIRIRKEYQALPAISVHPGKLIQVLLNIIANAIDAVQRKEKQEEAVITIGTTTRFRDKTAYAVIGISDNGPGIPEDILNNIFDPFFTTKKVGEGTGLGLSISIGIIQEHHGMIEVESKNGSGTTFSLLLPLDQEAA